MPANSTHLDYDASLPSWLRARDVIAGEDAVKTGGNIFVPEGVHTKITLLGATDAQLKNISADSGTGLSLDEMKRIRDYFSKKSRNPTDVELQALGQAWSEHCCYKSSKLILKIKLLINCQKWGCWPLT